VDLALDRELAEFLLDAFTDFYVAYFDRMFSAAPGAIDIFRIADDLGMQDRLLISPETFNAFIGPRIARLADMAHSHGIAVMFHSCGAILPLIDPLIAAGVDILDPIQVTAAGMDPTVLKNRFGDRLCFHGAIDTQYLLPQGTPQEVEAEAAKMIRILGGDGNGDNGGCNSGDGKSCGYILSPSHVLQSDVPIDNIRALYGAKRSIEAGLIKES
jgi:uroporphyrinogen decarboxylase